MLRTAVQTFRLELEVFYARGLRVANQFVVRRNLTFDNFVSGRFRQLFCSYQQNIAHAVQLQTKATFNQPQTIIASMVTRLTLPALVLLLYLILLSRSSQNGGIDQQLILNTPQNLDASHDPFFEDSPQGTGVLSQWARASKSQFFTEITENRAEEWVVVMGNEAGDTDSMAAAIAWAYHLSHLKDNSQKAIALLQTVEDALDLRPENQLALEKSHMSPRHRDLLTVDELPIKPFELSRRLAGIVLVDHNMPTPGWRHAPILSLIDHHVDQKMNLSATPRVLETSASCSSLVANLILESEAHGEHWIVDGERSGVPTDLVDLLLRAIALDSKGLEFKQSYEVDRTAGYGLFKLSQWYTPPHGNLRNKWEKRELRKIVTNFWAEMADARGQLEELDLRDLLRRDWKSNTVKTAAANYPYINLGFASIPCSVATQINRTPEKTIPEWFAIERAFTAEIGADVSVVLTRFTSEATQRQEREIMLVVAHGWGKRLTSKAATDLFETLCQAIEGRLGGLEDWTRSDGKPLLPRRRAWRIREKGPHVGRKLLMPLVLGAAAEWAWNSSFVLENSPVKNQSALRPGKTD